KPHHHSLSMILLSQPLLYRWQSTPRWGACHEGSVLDKVQYQTVEVVSMFPLRPVAALAEHVQRGVGDHIQQLQTPVDGHKAVITPPDDQRLIGDVREVIGVIAHVELTLGNALQEVVQV